MKQNQRYQKPLSVLLCLAMLLSLFVPFAAFAEGDAEHTHVWNAGVVTTEATCTVEGVVTYTCTCGETKTESTGLNLTKHVNTIEVPEADSTCQERGYTAGVQCTDCGNFISGHKIKPYLPHKFTEYTYNNDAKCGVTGTKTASCDYGCGATETIVAEGTALQHDWGEWTVVKEETCTKSGLMRRVCAHDETHAQTKKIPATGHVDENEDGVCDVCYEKLTPYRCPLCSKNEAMNRSKKPAITKAFYRAIHFVVHTAYALFWGY